MNNIVYRVSIAGKVLRTCESLIQAYAIAEEHRLDPAAAITVAQKLCGAPLLKFNSMEDVLADLVRNRATRYCITEEYVTGNPKRDENGSFVFAAEAPVDYVVRFFLAQIPEMETMTYHFDPKTKRGFYRCCPPWRAEDDCWLTYKIAELD